VQAVVAITGRATSRKKTCASGEPRPGSVCKRRSSFVRNCAVRGLTRLILTA
jgi:hypothetical protein